MYKGVGVYQPSFMALHAGHLSEEHVYAKETRGKGYVRIRKRIISITGFGL